MVTFYAIWPSARSVCAARCPESCHYILPIVSSVLIIKLGKESWLSLNPHCPGGLVRP